MHGNMNVKFCTKSAEFLGVYRKWETAKICDGAQYRRYSQVSKLSMCYVCCSYYDCYCSWWLLSVQSEREDYWTRLQYLFRNVIFPVLSQEARCLISVACPVCCICVVKSVICILALSSYLKENTACPEIYLSLRVNICWSTFHWNHNVPTNFRKKKPKTKFHGKFVRWESLRSIGSDGQPDITMLHRRN